MEGDVSVNHIPSDKDKLSPVRNYSDEAFCSESSDGNQSNRSKNSILLEKRRKTCTAAPGNPYRASASNFGARYVLVNANSKGNMNSIAQKVLSARMLRLKQLQNELNDAQFQINELASENRMLRTLQKRQDLALKRFEDKKADLPVLLNAHTEEVRTLRATIKQLRAQIREIEAKMKDRDTELALFRERCATLTDLCNNKQLEERDVLQKRVEELTKQNEEQAERIKLLNRKVALESKNYEHRLKTEITNHRNTQRELARVLENAAQLQAAVDEKEKFIRSKIYPASNSKRRNEPGSAVASFSYGNAALSRFPELQKGDQLQGSGKGSRFFSEESSHNRSHSTRFSLVQDQVTPQSSDEKLDQLQITGTKKLNASAPYYSSKQQKYGRRHQDHQTIQEDPDSDSQQTIASSGAELFDDVGEQEEHTLTTDELSSVSSPLEQQYSDQSKGLSGNVSERPLKFVSSLNAPKSSDNSPVTSQMIENSLKKSSNNVTQASHTSGYINHMAHSDFNTTATSPNSKYNSHNSEECSVEENNFIRSPSLTEIGCSGESETVQVQQPYTSVDSPKRAPKTVVIKEENVERNLQQHVNTEDDDKQSMFKKEELLAALEAIDKGKVVRTNVALEDTEIDMDRAKNKTNLMRELFGSS